LLTQLKDLNARKLSYFNILLFTLLNSQLELVI